MAVVLVSQLSVCGSGACPDLEVEIEPVPSSFPPNWRKFKGLFLAAFLLTGWRANAAKFEKLTAFPGADSTRIEATVSSDTPEPDMILTGRLVKEGAKTNVWVRQLSTFDLRSAGSVSLTNLVSRDGLQLWSPASPALYRLELSLISEGKIIATNSIRFGFRSFESRDGQFRLNGHPIFLRGLAINPPGRTVPEKTSQSRAFAEAYVGYLKSKHFNAIRLTEDSKLWFDVCDELGMLIFQGRYGAPLESAGPRAGPPADFDRSMAAYRRLFETYASHPSIVIYILANEMPTAGERGKAFSEYLSRACSELKKWDPTHPYIANAGYGEGREGDVQDVHRYWGWYYNTFLTFYNLRDQKLFGDPEKIQPLTFSECLGCFTGPNGEFNLILRKQLGAQLNWTGHSTNQRKDALDYQAFEACQITEAFRRLRPLNPRIAGVMPFTIGFANWSGITSFDQMHPNPVMEQFALSYQPVLLSWEMWTPQRYAGSKVQAIAHVINDSDDATNLTHLTLEYELRSPGRRDIIHSLVKLPDIPYYDTARKVLTIELPASLKTGDYELSGRVFSGDREISHNQTRLFVAGTNWLTDAETQREPVYWYDPRARLPRTLAGETLLTNVAALPSAPATLVIGEEAWDEALAARADDLKRMIAAGGRILVLRQDAQKFDTRWLPAPIHFFTASANSPKYPTPSRPYAGNMNINPERPAHPVFAGLDRRRFAWWSDYSGWDQTKPGFPEIYPITAGFGLTDANALGRTAVLADYDLGLEGLGLCEMFSGKGSVIMCGFDLCRRAGFDPVADRLLLNLVNYASSPEAHEQYPLIEQPILWGNYGTERGVITGPLNGLVVNADWIAPPTNPSAKPLTQAEGWWNTKPSDQFAPRGRRPFGVYGYTPGSGLADLRPNEKIGTGFFWARIPAGKHRMITKVRNPEQTSAMLEITVNEKSPGDPASIPAGEHSLTTDLPGDQRNLCVRFTGTKSLVLLETDFE